MALSAKRLGLVAVAITAWLLSHQLCRKTNWVVLFEKYQGGYTSTLGELIDILHLHRTAVRDYTELEQAQLGRENSAFHQRMASEARKCKQALLNLVLSPLVWGMVSRTPAKPLLEQIQKPLYRNLVASHILSRKGHHVGADLAIDAAAAVLGYRWSDFTQQAYRVELLLYHSGGLDSGNWAHECFEATSVLRQLFDPGTVTLPGLLEHQDAAGLSKRWLDYMSIWYDQSAANCLSDAGHMEVAEGPAVNGRRPAFLLWALPAVFDAPTSTMIWSHAFDLKSPEGPLRWRLVIRFNGTCMALGILPDTPPQRDHALAVVYALMVRDVDGGALTSTDLLLRQSHFQVRRRSRQPVMQPWDQCTPFQPPFPTSTPLPRLAEVAAVILLHDVPEEELACGPGQDAQSCDSYFPTVEELVLRPNKFYRHAPREFLEAWGLPPGSPGFVRSAVLDSMDLHGAWGLDRGGPEQRTFWVPGDSELPQAPPWGHAEGEESETDDSCSDIDLHGAWGLDSGGPEQCTFWVPGDSDLPPQPPWGGAEGEDSETDEVCSDADLSTDSSSVFSTLAEMLLAFPGLLAPVTAFGWILWLCWHILVLCLPGSFLRLTLQRLRALLCRASSLARGLFGQPQPSVPLGPTQRMTGTQGGIPRSRKRSSLRRLAAMSAAPPRVQMEDALTVVVAYAEMLRRARRSAIANVRGQAWQLVLWVLGPLASATFLNALENGLAAAFTVVQRASRALGDAAKCARKRDIRQRTGVGRASETNERSGKPGTNLAGSAMPLGSSGTRGKAQGKPTSSGAKQQQQQQQQQQQTSGSDADKPARSGLRSSAEEEGSSTATGCSQGNPALGDSSHRANEQLQVAANASALHPKPRVPSQKAWPVAREPAGASSSVATARASASATHSLTAATGGDSGRSGTTTAPAAPTRFTFRQRPGQGTQSAPQAIPLPAATEARAVSPVLGLVARSGRGRNRAQGSLAQQSRKGQAGQQAQQQQVPLQARASTAPAATAGAAPLRLSPPNAASIQPTLVDFALLSSRDLQRAPEAATVAAMPTPQQVLDTAGGQGRRARYYPIGLLKASSSSGSMASSASQRLHEEQQHSMGPSHAALWRPDEQGMDAASLPGSAAPKSLNNSSWPVSSAAGPPSLLPQILVPPAVAAPAVTGSSHPPGSHPPAAGAEAPTENAAIFPSEVPWQQPVPCPASGTGAAFRLGMRKAPAGHPSGHQVPVPIPLPPTATHLEGSVHSSHAEDFTAAEAECVLCWDAGRETVLAPCGHRALCLPCTELLLGSAKPQCPICRRIVMSYICREYDA